MNNYCWFYKGLLLLLFTGLSACNTANRPKTIDAVAVPDYSKRILNHPLYDSTDKFSFTTAVVRYNANKGYHKIPVGEYLLVEVMDIFKETNASKIKLSEFVSQCDPPPAISWLTRLLCKTNFSLYFEIEGVGRTISSNVESDVGYKYVKDQNLLGFAYAESDGTLLVNQAKLAVDGVLEYIDGEMQAFKEGD